MQQDLSQLTRELRKETCPQQVHDEVQRQISARGSARGWLHYALPAGAAAVVLACCVWIWHWPTDGNARLKAESAERASRGRAQTASQAANALEFVGYIMADAGARSEKVISDQAVPPLRNSFQTAKNKIIHIEL